jgi:acetylornithine deacetylase
MEAEVGPTLRAELDGSFEPPYTTTNVGLISGGKAKNVIPGSCFQWFMGQVGAW